MPALRHEIGATRQRVALMPPTGHPAVPTTRCVQIAPGFGDPPQVIGGVESLRRLLDERQEVLLGQVDVAPIQCQQATRVSRFGVIRLFRQHLVELDFCQVQRIGLEQ